MINTHSLNHPLGFRFLKFSDPIDFNYLDPHRHNCWEIIIFCSGNGTHTIDFRTWPYEENTIHFIQPYQVHLLEDKSLHADGAVLMFEESYFQNTLENKKFLITLNNLQFSDSCPILKMDRKHFDHLWKILGLIAEDAKKPGVLKRQILKNYLNIVLCKCLKHFPPSPEKSEFNPPHDLDLMLKFKRMVEVHFRKVRKVRAYAEMLYCTDKKLRRVCKTYTGMTPLNYIHDKIINEARRIMVYDNESMNQIAWKFGFTDPSHFSIFFKRNTGMSPGQFRSHYEMTIFSTLIFTYAKSSLMLLDDILVV